MILQIMDYSDRNPIKLKTMAFSSVTENIVRDQDEQEHIIPLQEANDLTYAEKNMTQEQEYDNDVPESSKSTHIKKKLQMVVLKNINSLKSCLKRRMAAKSYPESTDMVETGFPVLTTICSHSYEN